MIVPCAGADANVSELDPVPETLYDLVVECIRWILHHTI